jgi:hypothetical protein
MKGGFEMWGISVGSQWRGKTASGMIVARRCDSRDTDWPKQATDRSPSGPSWPVSRFIPGSRAQFRAKLSGCRSLYPSQCWNTYLERGLLLLANDIPECLDKGHFAGHSGR